MRDTASNRGEKSARIKTGNQGNLVSLQTEHENESFDERFGRQGK